MRKYERVYRAAYKKFWLKLTMSAEVMSIGDCVLPVSQVGYFLWHIVPVCMDA